MQQIVITQRYSKNAILEAYNLINEIDFNSTNINIEK